MSHDAVLAAALATLYAVAPEEFIGTRTVLVAQAKADGEPAAAKEIGALRRPSVAAWAINVVAREASAAVATLLTVGTRLREAQSQVDAATMQALRPERDAAIDAYVAAAVGRASEHGRPLSAAAQQEVRATAVAALADAAASHAVRSGQLVTSLSYSGFGEVDVSEAVARASSGSVLRILPGGRQDQDATKDTTKDTAASKAEAEAKAKGTAKAEAKAKAKAAAAARQERVAAAQQALDEAERDVDTSDRLLTEARRAHREAVRVRDAAQEALRRAREA